MNILADVARELLAMFLGDWKLSAAILLLIGFVSALIFLFHAGSLLAGAVLLLGCLAIIVAAALHETHHGSAT